MQTELASADGRMPDAERAWQAVLARDRSWDGRLQPPRLGAVRLALKAGVPIIPVRVDGAYDAWPRWDRKVKRSRIRIEFREPFRLPHADSRIEREPLVAEAAEQLMAALHASA